MSPRLSLRRLTATVTDAEGVVWVIRSEERRSAVLTIDRQAQSVAREGVLTFTSEFGEVRRSSHVAPLTWASGSPENLKALLARSAAVRPQLAKRRVKRKRSS